MRIIPLKRLGQNFIKNVPNEILLPVKFMPSFDKKWMNLTVVEIGPGTGNITKKLLEQIYELQPLQTHYIAIEFDKRMISPLTDIFEFAKQNNKYLTFNLVNADILKINIKDLVPAQTNLLYVFGALPYNISKPIIRHVFCQTYDITKVNNVSNTHVNSPQSVKLMTKTAPRHSALTNANTTQNVKPMTPLPFRFIIQKEVAEDYVSAPPNAKLLYWSVYPFVQKAVITKKLAPGNFHPAPKVTSAIVEFIQRTPLETSKILNNIKVKPLKDPELKRTANQTQTQLNALLKTMKIFYQQKRKTIGKVLKRNFKISSDKFTQKISELLKKRPATLTFENWIDLINFVSTRQE